MALIDYPDVGTVAGGILTGAVMINPGTTGNNPPGNIVEAVCWLLGEVPRSQTNEDLLWYFEYHGITGELKKIKLVTPPGVSPVIDYELYSDNSAFLNS